MAISALAACLSPSSAHRRRRRPDEDKPRLAAQLGEIGVLGQETVAWMDAFGADPLRQRDDRLAVEIALGADADLVRLIGKASVQGAAVGRRRQRDRAHAEPPRRADDPASDLAAIGDKNVGEHFGPQPRRGYSRRRPDGQRRRLWRDLPGATTLVAWRKAAR